MKFGFFTLIALFVLVLVSESFATIKVVIGTAAESHASHLKAALEHIFPTERIEVNLKILCFSSHPQPALSPRNFPRDLNRAILDVIRNDFDEDQKDIVYWFVTRIHRDENDRRWMSISLIDRSHTALTIFTDPFTSDDSLRENVKRSVDFVKDLLSPTRVVRD